MPESTFHRPRKVTLVEGVVEQIVNQIANGTLKPGDRLPSERQLIEDLQIGRSSVREALQGLAVMGYVEIRPGHGTYVTQNADALVPSRDAGILARQADMRFAHIDARLTVERETTRLAAERADEHGIARLTSAWEGYRETVIRRRNLEAATDHHASFHISIAHIGGNPFYPQLVSTLLRSVPPGLRMAELIRPEAADLTADDLIDRELEIHRVILEAITAHDGERAVEAMEAHMEFERTLVHRLLG